MTPENTGANDNGTRYCKTCRNNRSARTNAKRRLDNAARPKPAPRPATPRPTPKQPPKPRTTDTPVVALPPTPITGAQGQLRPYRRPYGPDAPVLCDRPDLLWVTRGAWWFVDRTGPSPALRAS